jgi:peroxisomal membrane protein 2
MQRKTLGEKPLARGWTDEAVTLFQNYDNQMKKRPIITKIWSCFFIGVFGNMLSQLLMSGSLSAYRMITYGLFQVLYFAPVVHYWFQVVEEFGNLSLFSQVPNFMKVLSMTAFDQTIGAPLILSGFFIFFTCWSALLGGTCFSTGLPALLAQGFAKVVADLPATLVANWKLWPFANFINFRFVPLDYRIIFTNVVSIFWNIYLSAMVTS